MATNKVRPGERKEIRIGMLGCGFMGRCHTNAYKKIPYIYPLANILPRLMVLCDQKADVVERAAAYFGYEEYTTDWKELTSDPRIEVFDNCGPDPVHPDPCIAALAQGKHVVCEKPMAVSVADARASARCGGRGCRQGHVYVQLPLYARRAVCQEPDQ